MTKKEDKLICFDGLRIGVKDRENGKITDYEIERDE